jgi:dienelactone hydrolase
MRLLAFCVLLLCSLVGLADDFSIGRQTLTFQDAERSGRNVPTLIAYPSNSPGNAVDVADGVFPVIIIGHGFVMGVDAYENYIQRYVPQGYIVALPSTEGSFLPDHAAFGADLAFLVEALNEADLDPASPFYEHIRSDYAIMGHSMGGGAAFLAAENNSEIRTVIGLAPAETNTSAITAAEHAQAPVLIFSGGLDGVTPIAQHSGPIYAAVDGPCRHHIIIEEGGHCNFADFNFACSFGEVFTGGGAMERSEQHAKIYRFLDPWLDLYLNDETSSALQFEEALSTEAGIVSESADCPLPCPPPTELSVTRLDLDRFELNWENPSSVSGFLLRARPENTPNWYSFELNGSSFTTPSVPLSRAFEWQLQSICTTDSSAFVDGPDFMSDCPSSEVVGSTLVSDDAVELSWIRGAYSVGTQVQGRALGSASWLSFNTVQETFISPPLQAGQSYEWRVSNICRSNPRLESAPSDIAVFDIPLAGVSRSAVVTDEVRIYPNPATEVLYIQGLQNVSSMIITDITGRVLDIDAEQTGDAPWRVDIQHLPNGVYHIQYSNGLNVESLGFIKQ